jgi:TRAP-type C4-dicarboxylate transport system permease large subunit
MVISLVTPPVGSTLFVASGVGKVNINALIPYVVRFFVPMLLVQLLVTYLPFLSTFLPSLMK